MKSPLDKVPLVASTPIDPVLVLVAAGFIAGSTPIKGTFKLALRKEMLLVVAVLQATTIILHPLSNSQLEFFLLKVLISSSDFCP